MRTEAEVEQLNQAVLVEHAAWMARLETERWSHSGLSPDAALKDLIAREGQTRKGHHA